MFPTLPKSKPPRYLNRRRGGEYVESRRITGYFAQDGCYALYNDQWLYY